jgi:hypothetical protein
MHNAHQSRSRRRPGGRGRVKPSIRGSGRFFRIEVAPARRFITFRYHDVGKKGGVERISGQRQDGTWETAGWLISKDMAHLERGRLVPDAAGARKVLARSARRHAIVLAIVSSLTTACATARRPLCNTERRRRGQDVLAGSLRLSSIMKKTANARGHCNDP